jgi:hypothetical protein
VNKRWIAALESDGDDGLGPAGEIEGKQGEGVGVLWVAVVGGDGVEHFDRRRPKCAERLNNKGVEGGVIGHSEWCILLFSYM